MKPWQKISSANGRVATPLPAEKVVSAEGSAWPQLVQRARLVAGAWRLGEACPARSGRYSRAVANIPLEAEL